MLNFKKLSQFNLPVDHSSQFFFSLKTSPTRYLLTEIHILKKVKKNCERKLLRLLLRWLGTIVILVPEPPVILSR